MWEISCAFWVFKILSALCLKGVGRKNMAISYGALLERKEMGGERLGRSQCFLSMYISAAHFKERAAPSVRRLIFRG